LRDHRLDPAAIDTACFHFASRFLSIPVVASREQNSGQQGNAGYNDFYQVLPGFHNTSVKASRSAEQAAKAPSIWAIEARDSGG